MTRSGISAFLLAATVVTGSAAGADHSASTDVVRQFYRWDLGHTHSGLQSEQDLAPVSTLLTPKFHQLLISARKHEAACAAATPPDQKPDIWESRVFDGSNEKPTELHSIVRSSVDGNLITVTLRNTDRRFPVGHPYRVNDSIMTVRLVLNGNELRIADFQYDDGTSLATQLDEFIREPCRG